MNEISKNTIFRYIFILGFIVLLDILTIISSIYIAPVLESYGMPDILIYLKFLAGLTTFILFILHYQEKINLPVNIIRILLAIELFFIIGYFLSIFLYKQSLLIQVNDIILNKILKGNPSIAIDLSRKNYHTLEYLINLNTSTNSEFFLLLQTIAIQYAITKTKNLEILNETQYKYDDFLYDKILRFLPITLLVFSFLSINLITYKYDILDCFEMGISLLAFTIILPSVYLMQNLQKTKNSYTTKTTFVSTHLYIYIISIICIVLYLLLIGINITLLVLNQGSYRIITSVISLLLSILTLIKSRYILSLENK